MKEVLYAAERDFLERYLKERASATLDDFKAVSDLWGNPIPDPGSEQAVDEIYSVDGDTAHIKIEGPLSPEGPDKWDRFWGYGGASYTTIRAAMERAKTSHAVAKVIFDINSPGGTVVGSDETWQAHKALAAEKLTEVHATDLLCSAAYELATPAHKILVSAPTTRVGSIGVLVATWDWSGWEKEKGVRRVIITSSNAPDKRPDITTEHGRNTIKAQLDAIERIFYARISEGRGVTTEHIAEHFGRGGLLVAQDPSSEHEDAIRSRMIDGLTTDTVPTTSVEGENEPQVIHMVEEERKLLAAAWEKAIQPGVKYCDASGKVLPPEECERIRRSLISMQTPSVEEQNTPAPAGKTQEGQMNLTELLNANPAAKAEVDALVAKARDEAKAELSARVDKVLPIIQSADYPANIKIIACNVLAGKEEMAAFTATVSTFDTMKEAGKSVDAQVETAEIGAVSALAPDGKLASEKEIDAALQAELDKRKVA